MKNFLKQLQLSEEAIELYLNAIGKPPLTFYEQTTLIPTLTPDDFTTKMNELIELNLIVKIKSDVPEILDYYLAIPPFSSILSYYKNINAYFSKLGNQLQEIMANVLSQVFQEAPMGIDSIFEHFQEIKNDIEEDLMIERQDINDLLEEFDKIDEKPDFLNSFQEILGILYQKIKGITQTQFSGLIKTLKNIETSIVEGITALELKKNQDTILSIIQTVFQEKLQTMIGDFTNTLYGLIETEFNNIIEPFKTSVEVPIQDIISKTINLKNELKSLNIDLLDGFGTKINSIDESISEVNNNISDNLVKLQNSILEKNNEVMQNALVQIAGLNKPIEEVMEEALKYSTNEENIKVDKIWYIKSLTKINEEIMNIINTSTKQVKIIIPKMENHLNLELFQTMKGEIIKKIASSDPNTNSTVKSYKEIANLEFRSIKNDNLIACKGDNKHLAIAIMLTDSQDPLNNCMGIGTNDPALINLLSSLIETTWASAQSDFSGTRSPSSVSPAAALSRGAPTPRQAVALQATPSTPRQAVALTPTRTPTIKTSTLSPTSLSSKFKAEIPKSTPGPESLPTIQPAAPVQSGSVSGFTSSARPKPGDKVSELINSAFNALIQQMPEFKRKEFSKALLSVTDIILENKGYSFTLNSIKKTVTKYRMDNSPLDENDMNEILQSIEEWKQKLFS